MNTAATLRKAYVELHISVFLFGLTAIVGEVIQLSGAVLVWYRLLFTCVSYFIILKHQESQFKLTFRELITFAAVGMILILHWVTFFAGIKLSNVSIILICLATQSFFTSILEPLLLKKTFRKQDTAISILSITGVYLIACAEWNYIHGIIVGLISALLSVLYSIWNKKIVATYHETIVNTYELGSGFLLYSLILPIWLHFFPENKLLPTVKDFILLLFLSLVCTTFAYNLTMRSLKSISAFSYMLAINLEPVYGILFAWILLGDRTIINPGFLLGASLVMLAVIINTWLTVKNKY
ncbi:MAG: DMT family transporter [Bacteroidia bacterium]|nr:DMT family transporter [Bacteroidia bacterium]